MRRPSSAHVLASIALACSLGGTAWATATITGRDVRDGSLTGADVRDNSLQSRDVQNSSLTGGDIRDGSVGPADLSAPARQLSTNVIASGTTLRGLFLANQNDPTTTGLIYATTVISYGGFQMPSPVAANIIGSGEPSTTECPGTTASPEAAPGNLCVYLEYVYGATAVDVFDPNSGAGDGALYNLNTHAVTVIGTGKAGIFGAEVSGTNATASFNHLVSGSWAATAPAGG